MLPTLALIQNEKTVDYVAGFDQLGGKDDFTTEMLEERLAKSEVREGADACLMLACPLEACELPVSRMRSRIRPWRPRFHVKLPLACMQRTHACALHGWATQAKHGWVASHNMHACMQHCG